MATKKIGTRITAIAAAVAASTTLIGSMAMPDIAYAVQETRVYTWANGERQPDIPQTITGENGQELTLISTTNPTQADASRTVTQSFNQTVSSNCNEGDIPNLSNIVAPTYHIDSGGFVGDIPRTGIDYTPIYRNEDRVFETTDTILTQSDDQGALPANVQTISYQGHTLALTGVDFTPISYEAGQPVLFQATLHYSGTFPEQVLDHYAVTAYYSGSLTRVSNDGEWSISATYEGPDEEDDNPEAGVTATFNDDESGTFTSNPDDPNRNNTNSNTAGTNTNRENNGNDDDGGEDQRNDGGFPIIPVAVGAGVVVLAGAGVGIGVAASKRKKKHAVADGAGMQPVGYDEQGNAIMPDGSVIAPDGAVLVAATAANQQTTGGEDENATASFIADDPSEPIECELIQVTGDGDDEQTPIALLDVAPSIEASVPTIITLPAVDAGEEFYPTEGADYYIAIEDVSSFVSEQMMIVSADGQLVYQGPVVDQMRLDTDLLVNSLNGTVPPEQVNDVSALVSDYAVKTDELRAQRDAERDAAIADNMDIADDETDFGVSFDDYNMGQNEPGMYNDDQAENDAYRDQYPDNYEDQMDRVSDMASIYGGEPESAYGDIDMGDGVDDTIDYDPYEDASINGMNLDGETGSEADAYMSDQTYGGNQAYQYQQYVEPMDANTGAQAPYNQQAGSSDDDMNAPLPYGQQNNGGRTQSQSYQNVEQQYQDPQNNDVYNQPTPYDDEFDDDFDD